MQKTSFAATSQIFLLGIILICEGHTSSISMLRGCTGPEIEFTKIKVRGRGPMKLWEDWYMEAKTRPENIYPEVMSMSTVQKNGHPAARMLLLRGYNETGFKIYTDYISPKAQELAGNNWTALVFFWSFVPHGESKAIGMRQVRIEGYCTKLSRKENMKYFESEPLDAKVRAFVQRQSQCVGKMRMREIVNTTQRLLKLAQCTGYKIPFPDSWGGYLVVPRTMEFYQNDPNSIGDRIKFRMRDDLESSSGKSCTTYTSQDGWVYERLEV